MRRGSCPAGQIAVPLPGGPLCGTAAELRAAALYLRQDLRRQIAPGAWVSVYTVRLPGGRRVTGSPAILLRLADRIIAAADTADPPVRARVGPVIPSALALQPAPRPPAAPATVALLAGPGERGTQRLGVAAGDPAGDPADPDAPPGPTLQGYWGCVWVPDATGPDGWRAATPEVEVREWSLRRAAVRLAVVEGVDLADDELLAVRWAEAPAPTCFLTAAQVRYARAALPSGAALSAATTDKEQL